MAKGRKPMTNEETNRPYDSAWGMYYDEFDNAKPDEIKTWVDNHTEQDAKGGKPMTNAEAKEIVKRIKGYMGDGECWSESEFIAMDKAIKALEVLEDMPTMVYPQVDGITPTVVMPSEINTIIENQEEMDVIGYKLVDDDDKKVSKKLISAFVQGAISDDNEREKVLKYIEEISE